jgi:hypothetical protein
VGNSLHVDNWLWVGSRLSVVSRHAAGRVGVPVNDLSPTLIASYGVIATPDIWRVYPLDADWVLAVRFVVEPSAVVPGEIRIHPRETDEDGSAQWAPGEWSGVMTGHKAAVPAGGLTPAIARRGADQLHARLIDAQRVIQWTGAGEIKMARAAGLTRRDPFSEGGLWESIGVNKLERLSQSPGRLDTVYRRYAKAADLYVTAIQTGHRAPVRAVARRLRLGPTAARDIIHQARVHNLLLPRHAKTRVCRRLSHHAARDNYSRSGQ